MHDQAVGHAMAPGYGTRGRRTTTLAPHRRAWCSALLSLACPAAAVAQGAATHSTYVWSVTFARNDSTVATVAQGEFRIWALPSGELKCRLDGNYYGARVLTDGESGFHVTFTRDRSDAPLRAIVIDGTDCAQQGVPVPPATFRRGRESLGTRLTIRSEGEGYVLETPTGTRLQSRVAPTTLDVGDMWYACTETEKHKLVYFRLAGSQRPEKIGESDPHNFKGCGSLALSSDSSMLLNAGAASAIDLRRKRVIVSHGTSLPTSVGIDPTRARLAVGHNTGVDVVSVQSGDAQNFRGGQSRIGYVSISAAWEAIRSSGAARPLVELFSPRYRGVVLDDARSRPGADILVAREIAEVRARNDSVRRVREAEAAENARIRASNEARAEAIKTMVENLHGKVSVSARLRQVQYEGPYEFVTVTVNVGDLLVLVSERDGTIGYRISDGVVELRGERSSANTRNGFTITTSTMTGSVTGSLRVQGRGSTVYAFIVRRADVK